MKDVETLLPYVLTEAPQCPEPLAIRKILEAARDFCKRTRVWKDIDRFRVSSPECEGLVTIDDADICFIEHARLDETDLTPVTPAWLDTNMPQWQSYEENAGPAKYITQINRQTVTVVPKVEGTLRVRLVLMPSRDAVGLPDVLVDDYGEVIGGGAAALVLMTNNPGVANPQLGLAKQQTFNSRTGSAKAEVARGQQRAPLRSRGSFF